MILSSIKAMFRFAMVGIVVSVFAASDAHAQRTGTQRGATLGGIAGAIAGSIIGENNDEPAAGALIGGAVGAVTGGMLGNANDQDRAAATRRQYQYQQPQQQLRNLPSPSYQSQPITPVQTTVSLTDVASMSRSGLSDNVIINEIRKRGVQHSLQVNDIIALHQQGVSEAVITEMQRTPVGQPATSKQVVPPPVVVHQAPVIYQREVLPSYPVPVYHPPVIHHRTEYYHGHSPHRTYRRSRGTSWGVHFGF